MNKSIRFFDRLKIDSLLDQAESITFGKVEIDPLACRGCGLCVKACPASALEIQNDNPRMVEDFPFCMSCGDCIALCPEKAMVQTDYLRFRKAFRYLDRAEPCPPRTFESEEPGKEISCETFTLLE